ncbi:DUF11 domain-containing protein [Halioglobus sp. HI00S01]|uniref:DUF11 domain-containing protein n=1 Tax=Halioglobus sp. HI00S01 TaxID=1822214 RepID=UPI0018D3A7A1|nr:DUF11 domain-containing protein [Halioglobus sp. HI00S01]
MLVGASASAQVPSVTVAPPTALEPLSGLPVEPLIGERFCAKASFENIAGDTGYGPYLIAAVDPGISQLSVSFVDVQPVLAPIGTFGPDGVLIDPISGAVINGVLDGAAENVLYPVGAVDVGTPALDLEFCGVVDVDVTPEVPLLVTFIPGFQFGDTPTGDNGAIVGQPFSSTVTPKLARLRKWNTAPENERPPGPSHPFSYLLDVDVSEGVLLAEVALNDELPPEVQWTGRPITIDAPLGQNCGLSGLPNFPPNPGGAVALSCDSLLGSSSDRDLRMSVPVYITDILDETFDDRQPLINEGTLDYDFGPGNYQDSDPSEVVAVHGAVQKILTEGNRPPAANLPGDVLTYSVNFQLTDYPELTGAGANNFVITDVVPDGLAFIETLELDIDGTIIPGADVVVSIATDTPSLGETTITWDIGSTLGSPGSFVPNGVNGRLRYRTEILTRYKNPDGPVNAGDRFFNTASADFGLTEGASGSDDTDERIDIERNVADKVLSTPPSPGTGDTIQPGSLVTFTLSLSIPAGSSSNVVVTDYLPKPVFDVVNLPPTVISSVPPLAESILDNDNAVRLEYGNIESPTPLDVEIEITAEVTSEPFADELFLTNLMQTQYTDTDGRIISDQDAAGITVGAPELVITKGIVSIDNPAASLDPGPTLTPVDSDGRDADAFDRISYRITVENVGSQPAYFVTISDPEIPELDCDDTSVAVTNGTGDILAPTGSLADGLVIPGVVSANDDNPAGGGAPFGDDTVFVDLDCTLTESVTPLQVVSNTASVTWVSTNDANDVPFPAISDDANVTIAAPVVTKSIVGVTPGYVFDASAPPRAQIGEVVTYQLEIRLPEGTTPVARLEDILDEGFAHVAINELLLPAEVESDIGNAAAILNRAGFLPVGGGSEAPDRLLVLGPTKALSGFGTLVNRNDDNSVAEVLRLQYQARVLNSAGNVAGQQRRNVARWFWQTADGIERRVQDRASSVIVSEPDLRLRKRFTPDIGNNTTPPAVQITVSHRGASSGDAFDLEVVDQLPLDFRVAGGTGGVTLSAGCGVNTTVAIDEGLGILPDLLSVTLDEFPLGAQPCQISFDTELKVPELPAGALIENCAELQWQSLFSDDQPLIAPPNNTIAVERTGDVVDIGGAANDYRKNACDVFQVLGVGIVKSVTGSSQSHTDNVSSSSGEPGVETLTIGEKVDFALITTVPDVAVLELEIVDFLPRAEVVLEYIRDSVEVTVGSDLQPDFPDPDVIESDSDSDGVVDTITLDFGNVLQFNDGVVNEDDRIRINFTAQVLDVPSNRNNDVDANNALAKFVPATESGSDSYPIEIVEPLLNISKAADVSQADASDEIRYRLTVEHNPQSRVNAQEVVLQDELPDKLTLIPASLALSGNCTDPPEELLVSGRTITAQWDDFVIGATCDIEFSATVDILAIAGELIVNEADLSWSSLNDDEQPADPQDRVYTDTAQWEVIVSPPGLLKRLTATSEVDTPEGFFGDAELTIGEEATFTLASSFPDGTTLDAVLSDLLPSNDVELELVAAEVTAIGGDLLTLAPGVVVGQQEGACTPASPECLQWEIGTVINAPDNRPTPDEGDVAQFDVTVRVIDSPVNSGAPSDDKDLLNRAILKTSENEFSSVARFDIVEPKLRLAKLTSNGTSLKTTTAGAQEVFTLRIEHTEQSTANARRIVVTDELSPQTTWIRNDEVDSNCAGLVIQSPGQNSTGVVTFEFDRLRLAGQSCEISYPVTVSSSLPDQGVFVNRADMQWRSGESDGARAYDTAAAATLYRSEKPVVSKQVAATSVSETRAGVPILGQLPQVAIGEQINYRLVLRFPEGETDNVVVEDLFDNTDGVLTLLGGDLTFLGRNITVSSISPPIVDAESIRVVLGDVENNADLQVDLGDVVVLQLDLQVRDISENAAGDILTNEVNLSFGSGLAAGVATASVDVEVVEPELLATKKFIDTDSAVVTLEIGVENVGNAPAFDLMLIDEFPVSVWLPGSLDPVSVPKGFRLTEALVGDQIEIKLVSETVSTTPSADQVLLPGNSNSVTFSMTLQNDGLPGPTSIENTATIIASSLPGVFDDGIERTYTVEASDTLQLPAVDLLKSWSGPNDPALPGDTLLYTVTARNTGQALLTDVNVTDEPESPSEFQSGTVNAPGGVVVEGNTPGDSEIIVEFAAIAPGAEATFSYQVKVPLPYPAGIVSAERLENQAILTSKELPDIRSDDPTTIEPDDITIVPIVADPIMSIGKTDNEVRADPGDLLAYEISYGNAGNQDATGVVISETVPANTTFQDALTSAPWICTGRNCTLDIGTLAGGESTTADFVVRIDDPISDTGVFFIENTVGIVEDGLEFDGPSTPSADTGNDFTFLQAFPELVVVKNDGGTTVIPGQTYAFEIAYGNVGDEGALNVTLSETVPEFTTFSRASSSPAWVCDGSVAGSICTLDIGDLPAGTGGVVEFGLTTDFPALAGAELILNTVRVEAEAGILGLTLEDADSDITPLIARPDLEITKDLPGVEISIGDVLVYRVLYKQVGNQNATGVVVREIVPLGTIFDESNSSAGWSCAVDAPAGTLCELSVGNMEAGESREAMFAVKVTEISDTNGIQNVVTVSDNGSNGLDPTPENNIFRLVTPYFLETMNIPAMPRALLILLVLGLCLMGANRLRHRSRRDM